MKTFVIKDADPRRAFSILCQDNLTGRESDGNQTKPYNLDG